MLEETKKFYNLKDGWVLHHVDPMLKYDDPDRYAEYRIEDVVPMTDEDHRKYHNHIRNMNNIRPAISKGIRRYRETNNLVKPKRHCKVCGATIRLNNKTGYCAKCLKSSDEWKQHLSEIGSIGGKNKGRVSK